MFYYFPTPYAGYRHCCLTNPSPSLFETTDQNDELILEFRPRFGNGYLSIDPHNSAGWTEGESYSIEIRDLTGAVWKTAKVDVAVGGALTIDQTGSEAYFDADGRLDVRQVMVDANTELGSAAGGLFFVLYKTYDGGGSPDDLVVTLRWEAI